MPIDDAHSPADPVTTVSTTVTTVVTELPEVQLEELLEQIAEGNRFAFRELYNRTCGQIYAVLLRILENDPVAENALIESYVNIWGNARKYQEGLGTPFTWMTNVARHQALDILRKARKPEGLESGLIRDTESLTARSSGRLVFEFDQPALLTLSDGNSELLSSRLARLDENQRNCILKAYCEGYSHEELSVSSGSSLGTVKSWIRRGLLGLRESVNELS